MTHSQKKGKLRVVAGGLYASRVLSPDEQLERDMRSLFAAMKADEGDGPYASRGIANVAHSINAPHRILARRMREAREARVRHALVRQVGQLFVAYADRLYATSAQAQRPDPDPSPVTMRKAA